MSSDLASHGITEAKTFTLKFPDICPTFFKHFIRGYVDGDGSFSVYDKYPGNTTFTVTGTRSVIKTIQNILVKTLNVNNTKWDKRRVNTEIFTLRYTGNNQVRLIHEWLYSDATVFLARKKNLLLPTV